MSKLKLVSRKTFRNQRVRLDGRAFISCRFINCTIEYSGGDVRIEDTYFDRPAVELTGAASNTVGVLHVLGALNEEMFSFRDGEEET